MAVALYSSGAQTVTATGNEYILASCTTSGVFDLHLGTSMMADGDIIEVRAYQRIATSSTGGSPPQALPTRYLYGAQDADITGLVDISPPIMNELTASGALRFTFLQRAGTTGDTYHWKILRAY